LQDITANQQITNSSGVNRTLRTTATAAKCVLMRITYLIRINTRLKILGQKSTPSRPTPYLKRRL